MLIDEQNIMLETGVKMGFKTKFSDDWVVVAIYVGIDTIHSLEDLTDHAWERLWKWNA